MNRIFRILSSTLFGLGLSSMLAAQTLIPVSDELILPRYSITGNTTGSRLQYVCRLRLSGLTANATYRYFSGASTSTTITTSSAPGNFFAIANTPQGTAGYVTGYSSGKSMNGSLLGATPNENEFTSSNRYSQFTTDATGSYTGWFACVPTSNAVYAPGNDVYFYVQLNNGAGGTSITTAYRTTSTIHIIDYGTTSGNNNQATALRGTSNVAPENLIFVYDNTAGTGRPIYGTWTENDGIATTMTTWYSPVEGVNGSWGAVIPNSLPNGIRRIEARDVTNANILGCPSLDADGVWPSGVNTVNPNGSTTPLVITTNDAPLQFVASSNSPVCPGTQINLSSTSGSTYSWTGPNSFSNTSATPSITNAAAANAGTYSVQITDANGCSSTATTNVVVGGSVTATVSGGGTACTGNTVNVSIALSGSGPWDFTYSNGSTNTNVTNQATQPYVIAAGTSGVYTVTALTSGGCTGTSGGSATVTITPLPSAPTVTPASPTIYTYNSVTLTASGTGTFNWYNVPNNGSPIGTGANYTASTVTVTTTYYVDATSGGCTSPRTPVTVTVNPNPVHFTTYTYHTPFPLGSYHGVTIPFGGFSGLYSVPGTTDEFYSITDRGPNLDANNNVHAASNPNAKLFPLPGFTPTLIHFKTQGDSLFLLDTLQLRRPNGSHTTGIINPLGAGGTGELAFTDTSGAQATPDIWGIDSEGLTAGNNNDFWISEEYGGSVWRVNRANGQVINRYTPVGNLPTAQPQDIMIDSVFKYRNPNKGLEGVVFAPNGKVYSFIQNPIYFPASAASAIKSNSRLHRFVEIDPVTNATRMFGYEHDSIPPVSVYGHNISNGNRYIGDAVAINNHEFLVLEHGKSNGEHYAKVYKIDINAATPITQATYSGQTFEQLYTAANAQTRGITCVTKTLFIDLLACGYDNALDKEEGITIINDTTIAIVNDNDFGVVSPGADGNIALTGGQTKLYVFTVPQSMHLNLCRPAIVSTSSATTFCQGGSATLNAPTGTFTYQWSVNGSPITGATASTYAATAGGNYAVAVTDGLGCVANSATTAITVNSLPNTTITTGGPTTFCQGSNVALNAPTGSGLTYQWSESGNPISGETAASYTANASGNYAVTITNANSCTATSGTTAVTVNALPSASITAGGPTTFCQGANVTLNASTGSGYSYQWTLNSSNITGATAASYTANAAGSYAVIITNSNNCSATATPQTVTVNSLPTATINAGGPVTFCQGGNVALNASTGSGYTYQWMLNSSNITGATAASYTANAAGNYAVIITDANSCAATSSATTVTVNAAPSASITASGPTTFCFGGNVTLNAPTGSGLTYQWQNNSSNITGATSSFYTTSAAGNYAVMITNANGCSATSSTTGVTINNPPFTTVTTSGPTTFCLGGNVTLNASAVSGYLYQWMNNSLNVSGATNASYVVTSSGNYAVFITDANGCSASSMPDVAVTVNTPPATPAITQTGNVLSTASGYTYQWYLNGNPVAGATDSTYTAQATGNYTVEITDANGCSTLSNSYNYLGTGIASNDFVTEATIFPNPFHDQAEILLHLSSRRAVSIAIYNMLGELVGSVPDKDLDAGEYHIPVELSQEHAAGVYFIRINAGNENMTLKTIRN